MADRNLELERSNIKSWPKDGCESDDEEGNDILLDDDDDDTEPSNGEGIREEEEEKAQNGEAVLMDTASPTPAATTNKKLNKRTPMLLRNLQKLRESKAMQKAKDDKSKNREDGAKNDEKSTTAPSTSATSAGLLGENKGGKTSTVTASTSASSDAKATKATSSTTQLLKGDRKHVSSGVVKIGGVSYDRDMLRRVTEPGGLSVASVRTLLRLATTSDIRERTYDHMAKIYALPSRLSISGDDALLRNIGQQEQDSKYQSSVTSPTKARLPPPPPSSSSSSSSLSVNKARTAPWLIPSSSVLEGGSSSSSFVNRRKQKEEETEAETNLLDRARKIVREARAEAHAKESLRSARGVGVRRIGIKQGGQAALLSSSLLQSSSSSSSSVVVKEGDGEEKELEETARFLLRKVTPATTTLDLSGRLLGDAQLNALIRYGLLLSPRVSGLQSLSLDGNALSGNSLRKLVQALRALPCLRHLSLKRNSLGAKGPSQALDEFFRAAGCSLTLRTLDLAGNRIGTNAADGLRHMLRYGRLRSLRLEGNPLGLKCLWAIVDAVQTNTAVLDVTVDKEHWGPTRAFKRLSHLLERNRVDFSSQQRGQGESEDINCDPAGKSLAEAERRVRVLEKEQIDVDATLTACAEREAELLNKLQRRDSKIQRLEALLEEATKDAKERQMAHQQQLAVKEMQLHRSERQHAQANGELMDMLTSAREQLQTAKEEIASLNDRLIARTQVHARAIREFEARISTYEERGGDLRKEQENMFSEFRRQLRNIGAIREQRGSAAGSHS